METKQQEMGKGMFQAIKDNKTEEVLKMKMVGRLFFGRERERDRVKEKEREGETAYLLYHLLCHIVVFLL